MRPDRACLPRSTIYTPSMDAELEHRIYSFLHLRQVSPNGRIRLRVRGGTVVVSGKLCSSHAKWLCMECCRRVAGVIKIVDQLRIETYPAA